VVPVGAVAWSLIKDPDGDAITRRVILGGIIHKYDHAAHLQIAPGSTEDTAPAMKSSTSLSSNTQAPSVLDRQRTPWERLSIESLSMMGLPAVDRNLRSRPEPLRPAQRLSGTHSGGEQDLRSHLLVKSTKPNYSRTIHPPSTLMC
jgi:hypothetical protein